MAAPATVAVAFADLASDLRLTLAGSKQLRCALTLAQAGTLNPHVTDSRNVLLLVNSATESL